MAEKNIKRGRFKWKLEHMSNAKDTHAFLHFLRIATHKIQINSKSRYYCGNTDMNNMFYKNDQTFIGLNKHINLMFIINHISH